MVGIYKITSPNGKVYIGQSININRRFNEYKKKLAHTQVKLNRSFIKYGVDNHKFEIITECSAYELDNLECYFIEIYNSIKNGLNAKGGGANGYMPLDIRVKISKKHLGKKLKESTKEKLRNIKGEKHWNNGKKLLFCTKYKQRLKGIGRKHSQETKDKISNLQRESSINAKPVLDLKTGVFYKSPREVSELYNYNLTTLRCYLNGSLPNKTNFIYA